MTVDHPENMARRNGHHELDPGDAAPKPRIDAGYAPRMAMLLGVAVGIVVLLLVIGFAIAYTVRDRREKAAAALASTASDARPSVEVVMVQSTAGHYPLTLPGQTAGWYQSTIFARVDGYIGTWTADIGDRVKKGQVLATIETPDLDQELDAATAKAAASEAQVNVAESNAAIAKITYDRWKDSPDGVVSVQEQEEKKAAYISANAQLAEAKAQAQLDMADVGRYTALEAFKNVVAPYDGIITARHVDIGDLVSAGSSSNTTSLYSIAQSNVIRVFVDVPQKVAAQVSDGMTANVTSDQYLGRTFQGKVARMAMSMDPQTRTQRTEIDVPNKDLTLVPGMYVQATFELNQQGLLAVPAAAILFQPSGLQVAVVNRDDKVEFHPITVAKDNGDTLELSTGVQAGDRVALNISSAIAPGEQVNAVNNADGAPDAPAAPSEEAAAVDPSTPTAGAVQH